MAGGLGLILRLARRELRGGLSGFRIFLASLALGVAAIAAVGTVSSAILTGLNRDARVLLGGDVDLRSIHVPVAPAARDFADAEGTLTEIINMRAMAARAGDADGRRALVELKAVANAYPLVGAVTLSPAGPLDGALAFRDGVDGAVIDRALAARLGLTLGDVLEVGDARFAVRAFIDKEPDRVVSFATFGPRLMVALPALSKTGLVRQGSLIYYHTRVALDPGVDLDRWLTDFAAKFPDHGWRLRSRSQAAPGFSEFISRLGLYLSLVGLTSLLVGGVGVANAVRTFLERRTATIATLKCLGASSQVIFGVYFTQVLALAVVGTGLGLILGAAAPWAVARFAGQWFPFQVPVGIDPLALSVAAGFGLLTAAVFALWPIGKAVQIKAGHLFRALIQPPPGLPAAAVLTGIGAGLVGLVALTLWISNDQRVAVGFVLGVIGAVVVFRAGAGVLGAVLRRAGRAHNPGLRLAIANITRPGAPTGNLVLSLGLGVAVLIAVALVDANLRRQVNERMPESAPGYYFIDIQPHQVDDFVKIVTETPGYVDVQRTPMVRGRVTAIAGTPAGERKINPDIAWTLRGDRGLTYRADPPAASDVVAGAWWPQDYAGPPLVSVDAKVARGYGVGIGDTLEFNILGRVVSARIANLRNIDWSTLSMNFVFVFSPGLLERAPHSVLAAVKTQSETADEAVQRRVTGTFRNVSALRVKDALEAANNILSAVDVAVRLTALVTLVAGILVLAGALGTEQRRRIRDGVVLKVLGATRGRILAAHVLEYGLLGLITAVIAAAIGSLAAWVLVTRVMRADFVFAPGAVAGTVAACLAVTIVFGLFGTWRALGLKVAPMLRAES